MMNIVSGQNILIFLLCLLMGGCALGHKEWPAPEEQEDTFSLSLLSGERRNGTCLFLELKVVGARERLTRVTLQLEPVGDGPGQGCALCPFMPRQAIRISRGEAEFSMNGDILTVSHCELEPETEYRFRVVGANEISSLGYVYTDIYVATP